MKNIEYSPEELIPVVAELANKYTGYEHSSISYEKAQMLMNAVLYCIHELDTAEHNVLQANPISAKDAYLSGREIVMDKIRELQDLYNGFISDFQDFGSIYLKETIVKGIPVFLLHYDPLYAPQETLLSLDYPVLKNLGDASGIDAVLEYVNCICMEQRFLKKFDFAYVMAVLRAYHEDYGHLLENLCFILLQSIMEHMILQKPFNDIHYTEEDQIRMKYLLAEKSSAEIKTVVEGIAAEFMERYFDKDILLKEYISLVIPDIAARLPYLPVCTTI